MQLWTALWLPFLASSSYFVLLSTSLWDMSPSPLFATAPHSDVSLLSHPLGCTISCSTAQTLFLCPPPPSPIPLSRVRLFPSPRNLVQPSASPLRSARHWQMPGRPAYWRAVAPADNVNRLWIRKVRHDVPGKGALDVQWDCSLMEICRRGGIEAHDWSIITHIIPQVYLTAAPLCVEWMIKWYVLHVSYSLCDYERNVSASA